MVLSLSLAQKLKDAGLTWTPAKNDFFAVPDRNLDDSVFVISDMTVIVEKVPGGQLAVTFHGAVEWALDHILIAELVWLPHEGQLRELLEGHLVGEPEPAFTLTSTPDGYRCDIQFQGEFLTFESFGVSETYGLALLHLLKRAHRSGG